MSERRIVLEQGSRLREEYRTYTEAQRVVRELNFFKKVVKMLNSDMIDLRLDSTEGIVEALREIQQYNLMHGEVTLPLINAELDPQTGKLRVFFEV